MLRHELVVPREQAVEALSLSYLLLLSLEIVLSRFQIDLPSVDSEERDESAFLESLVCMVNAVRKCHS